MERGIYFTCWTPGSWNYHPSLPLKTIQMLEEVEDMEGTVLIWAGLGSGSIGLPYLHREAFDPVPPRLRFYGGLNDQEYCAEARKRGIKVFGVLWRAQMWEFPAEFNHDQSELLSLNVTRNVGKKGWIGVRELSLDKYPKLFRPMRDFFPKGVKNTQGKPVTDFLKECKTESLEGKDIYSSWLTVPGHDHQVYMPCFSNPVTRTYFNRCAEILIDAGVAGIHIDEQETPLMAIRLGGGCFCRDCINGFRDYVRTHPDPAADKVDLSRFNYRTFLLREGFKDRNLMGENTWSIPFFKSFVEYNHEVVLESVADLTGHIRRYAAKKRKEVLISGNFVDCLSHTADNRKHVDLVAGEKMGIGLRQDGWYRLANGFCNGKPSCFVHEPTTAHMQEMFEDIKDGINDKYILFMLEAYAQGVTLSVPYGGWVCPSRTGIRGAVYPDMRLAGRMGKWLKKNESLFTGKWTAPTALIHDNASHLEGTLSYFTDTSPMIFGKRSNLFRALAQHLCESHRLFDVLYVSPDEPLTANRLKRFRQIVLPAAHKLSEKDVITIRKWQSRGGRCLVVGPAPKGLDAEKIAKPGDPKILRWLRQVPQSVETKGSKDVAFQLHKTRKGHALHLINYRHDAKTHRIQTVRRMTFQLDWKPKKAEVITFPESNTRAVLEGKKLTVTNIPIYAIVHLT